MPHPSSILVSLLVTALVAGCGDAGSTTSPTAASTAASTPSVVMDPGDGGDYHPMLDSAHVAAREAEDMMTAGNRGQSLSRPGGDVDAADGCNCRSVARDIPLT